jgi:histone-lysine N-methyltransferase MLL5
MPGIAVVTEETNDAWNGSNNLDGYEVAKFNQYSVDVENLMASKKYNGQHWDSSEVLPSQLQAQLCEVVQITGNKKGLEASEDLISSQILIEYKGKVMLREQYDKENMFFKRVHPFVLFYSGFEGLDICIDANTYGNDARYVRRSCTPNAEVQHVVENGRIHFYVYSSKGISKGAEITIPFDFNYQECNYGVECACSKASCPVARFYSRKEEKLSRKKRSSKSSSLVDPKQVGEVKSNNSVRLAGTKRRRVTPLKLLTTTNKQEQIQVSSPPPTRRSAPQLCKVYPRLQKILNCCLANLKPSAVPPHLPSSFRNILWTVSLKIMTTRK